MDDRSGTVLALAIVFITLTVTTMAVRVYIRGIMLKAMGADDYTMLGALTFFIAYLGCQIGGVRYGTGRHIQDLEREDAQQALRYWYFCEVFYAPATTLLKVSVAFFLLRITTSKVQIWIIRVFMAGSVIFGLAYLFLIIFQCKPISFWWDLDPEHIGSCINPVAFTVCSYLISGLNTLADLTYAIIPMFIVWHTTMNSKTRAVVCVLLGIASIAGIITIVRIPYLDSLNHYKGDFLWNTYQVALLTTFEVGLGITAACAATFRPLVQRWLGSRSGTYGQPTTTKGQVVVTKSLRMQHMSAAHAGVAGDKHHQATQITAISRADSWSKMPDLIVSESSEALNEIRPPPSARTSDDMA